MHGKIRSRRVNTGCQTTIAQDPRHNQERKKNGQMSVLSYPMAKNQTKQIFRQVMVAMRDIWENKVLFICVLTSWAGIAPFFLNVCFDSAWWKRGPTPDRVHGWANCFCSFFLILVAEVRNPPWKTNCSRDSDLFGGLFNSCLFVSSCRGWSWKGRRSKVEQREASDTEKKPGISGRWLFKDRGLFIMSQPDRYTVCLGGAFFYLSIFRAAMTPFVSLFWMRRATLRVNKMPFALYCVQAYAVLLHGFTLPGFYQPGKLDIQREVDSPLTHFFVAAVQLSFCFWCQYGRLQHECYFETSQVSCSCSNFASRYRSFGRRKRGNEMQPDKRARHLNSLSHTQSWKEKEIEKETKKPQIHVVLHGQE